MPPVDAKIFARFRELCQTPSDIYEHLPILKEYADRCDHVTEFGVRGCVSLHAFLASKARKVVAYDIANVAVPDCEKLTFINADVLTADIEPTDLLMIDTLHTFAQLCAELARHAGQVKRYIACHDTAMFGEQGEDGSIPGLKLAIQEFLVARPEWWLCYTTTINNGLTILQRA